jgi:hypothetical protein
MGSFGCIVVSSMLNGPDGKGVLPRPIDSLMLVQGATSLWGFCSAIPDVNSPGYFRKLVDQRKVAGPIVTTQSKRDTAVGVFYPVAAGVALGRVSGRTVSQVWYQRIWIQAPARSHDLESPTRPAYDFKRSIYNLECRRHQGWSGASGRAAISRSLRLHAM